MGVIVVGAGISGVACARVLHDAGVAVRVLERDDAVGGRMASPRLDGRPVDLGAAYVTARDPEFVALLGSWQERGLARPWTDTLAVLEEGGRGSASGPMRWAAVGGLASLVADLADGLDVELGHPVRHVGPGPGVDGEPADAVVVAMPDPQAAQLLDGGSAATSELAGRSWRPVLTVATSWPRRSWEPFPAAFVNGHPLLTTLADDGERRGDGAPVLVAHTGTDGASAAASAVVDAVRELLGIDEAPTAVHTRFWPHAAPDADREQPFHLGADGIALAGDSWGSSRVETAWRSGTLLGRALAERLRAD